MEITGIVPAIGTVTAVLLGVWRMLAHYEKRNDEAHAELGRSIEAAETKLGQRIEDNYHRLDGRIRSVEQGFARIDQRLQTLERVIIPSGNPAG